MNTSFEWVSMMAGTLIFGSIGACAMILFAAVVTFLFRKHSAATLHTVWLSAIAWIVAIPCVAPWVPALLPASRAARMSSSEPAPPIPSLGHESPRNQVSPSEVQIGTEEPGTRIPIQSPLLAEPLVSQPMVNPETWKKIGVLLLVGVWFLGAIIFVFRVWGARRWIRRAMALSDPLEGDRLEVFVSMANSVRCSVGKNPMRKWFSREIVARVSRDEYGPLVWGCLPPHVLIPRSANTLSTEELRAAFAHELGHIVRRDEWTRRFLLLVRTVFWFHPFVRFGCDRVHLFAEKASDDFVLRWGHRPHRYSEFLLKMRNTSVPREFLAASSGMAQSQIAIRVRSLLDPNQSRDSVSFGRAMCIHLSMIGCSILLIGMRPAKVTATGVALFSSSAFEASPQVGANDWPQWGGSPSRNNVATSNQVPINWDIRSGRNILWSVPLGTQSYGGVVVANGQVYTGTNNGAAYLPRLPDSVDLGVLLSFRESDGAFLWQHSNRKLPSGRTHDWPLIGICSAPLVDGERLWYVTNRCEVVCLDTQGFRDNENDGIATEEVIGPQEADVVWTFDMMKSLGVEPHNLANCSVTSAGDLLFVNTSNGVEQQNAPSFLCLNRTDGTVVWTDSSPSPNILHGQWSSPAFAVIRGVGQVIFGGGDGFVYGFLAEGEGGKSKLLWKFDCNPKESKFQLSSSTRNHIIATPVVYGDLVYVAVGEDPEHGEGPGHLWCIDPSKRGDVSPTLVFNRNTNSLVPHKRIQALDQLAGDYEKANPNSAMVWHYQGTNTNEFSTTMHRTVCTVAIDDGLLFVADSSGLFHCLDAKTGAVYWIDDLLASCWSSPLIANGRVYIGDEEGDLRIYECSKSRVVIAEFNMDSSIYSTPIVANDTLYVGTTTRLWAIKEGTQASR